MIGAADTGARFGVIAREGGWLHVRVTTALGVVPVWLAAGAAVACR